MIQTTEIYDMLLVSTSYSHVLLGIRDLVCTGVMAIKIKLYNITPVIAGKCMLTGQTI